MGDSSNLLDQATEAFASLPGIGKKTALRLALHLLDKDVDYTSSFCESLIEMKSKIKYCKNCHFLSDEDLCKICSNPNRNKNSICVVENIPDVMAIEETGQYFGTYHVLGGVLSPMNGKGPESINIESLVERCKRDNIDELIMAISPTIDGDTTVFYLAGQVEDLDLKVSVLSRGIAFGGELVYTDGLTLGRSIIARTPFQSATK